MNKRFQILNAIGILAALIIGQGAFAVVKAGSDAPAFSVKGDDGKTYSNKELKGKTVVLEWYNDGCPYVKKYYNEGHMQALQKEYTGKGVVWLSVASNKAGSQGALVKAEEAQKVKAERKASPTSILLDSDGKMAKAFEAKTTPHMFIIDSKGKVVYNGAIDDQPSANKKTLVGAKNYVRLALDEVLAGKKVTIAENSPYGCSVKL